MYLWWEPGGLVPTAGVLPGHSSKEIPQKATGNKSLQQQWFQPVGSGEGLCRLGHHGLAATTQGTALSTADVTQTHTLMWGVALWFTWISQSLMTSVSSSSGCLTVFRWQRFRVPRCWTLLVAALRAEHSRSVELEPPVWLENGDSSIPGGESLLLFL